MINHLFLGGKAKPSPAWLFSSLNRTYHVKHEGDFLMVQ